MFLEYSVQLAGLHSIRKMLHLSFLSRHSNYCISPVRATVLNLLMLWLFNTVPHVVVTLNHKIILLLLQNYNIATIMNCDAHIWYTGYLICRPCKRVVWLPLRGCNPQIENCSVKKKFWELDVSLYNFIGKRIENFNFMLSQILEHALISESEKIRSYVYMCFVKWESRYIDFYIFSTRRIYENHTS